MTSAPVDGWPSFPRRRESTGADVLGGRHTGFKAVSTGRDTLDTSLRACLVRQNQDLRDYGGFTGLGRCVASFSPSDPSVRHWDRLFDSSPIKGEGVWSVVLSCCLVVGPAPHLWIAGQVRNDVTVVSPALWFPAYAGMTVRDAGYDGPPPTTAPLDCGSSPQ